MRIHNSIHVPVTSSMLSTDRQLVVVVTFLHVRQILWQANWLANNVWFKTSGVWLIRFFLFLIPVKAQNQQRNDPGHTYTAVYVPKPNESYSSVPWGFIFIQNQKSESHTFVLYFEYTINTPSCCRKHSTVFSFFNCVCWKLNCTNIFGAYKDL